MIRFGLLCGLIAGHALAAETMRVSMGAETQQATVSGEALAIGDDAEEGEFAALPSSKVTLRLEAGQLTVDGRAWLGDALRLRAGAQARDAGHPGENPITANGITVRGDVAVLKGKHGLLLVNVLPLEDYLLGVLGSEMPKSFPLEALKAQAVAARTYALNKKLEQYGQPFHLGSTVISQVYKGLAAEDPRVHEAVVATRGLVLTFDLQPIEAYFHSSCGGKTETGAHALGRDLPYLKAVSCPCGKLATSHWKLHVSPDELKPVAGIKPGQLRVEGRTPTGRARRVEVGARSVDAVVFRERVGYSKLKSLKFEVAPEKNGWAIVGDGFGHGAGLCQWGARLLADEGRGYKQILGHYYPGTELQVLY